MKTNAAQYAIVNDWSQHRAYTYECTCTGRPCVTIRNAEGFRDTFLVALDMDSTATFLTAMGQTLIDDQFNRVADHEFMAPTNSTAFLTGLTLKKARSLAEFLYRIACCYNRPAHHGVKGE